MARQKVVQLVCDRCHRVEIRPLSDERKGSNAPVFKALFNGENVEFEDLCTSCLNIIRNQWANINKKFKRASVQDEPEK